MQIKTPDIGVDKATVAEIMVKVGDTIAVDDSIVLLESDKASVEVPSTSAGVVKSISVAEGDSVSEGAVLIEVESADSVQTNEAPVPTEAQKVEAVQAAPVAQANTVPSQSTETSAQTKAQTIEVKVPDIGVEKALVGEILVQVGDSIAVDDSIVVVESDKATVEVPSTVAGIVESVIVKEGDSVKEGVVLITVKTEVVEAVVSDSVSSVTPSEAVQPVAEKTAVVATKTQAGPIEVVVPDLGVDKATISEILVSVGDTVEKDQSLCVAESDKASVEVPSTVAGVVKAIHVELNQAVKQGMALVTIEAQTSEVKAPQVQTTQASQVTAPAKPVAPQAQTVKANAQVAPVANGDKLSSAQQAENAKVYAGPAVRKLARELGVVLSQVQASGVHDRVVKDDVFAYVKTKLTAPQVAPQATAPAVASGLPSLPDFSSFGGGEVAPMTRLQQVSVPQLSLNNFIPQVTQFDHADITELEAWRGELKDGFKKQGVSLTILAFIAKAVAFLLKEEPYFAGHLADDQKGVLLRNEIHIGIAVATPDGLTVPVLRNPDQKSIKQIAIELGQLSQKARDKKLSPKDLQGANFTITSLGSIGGTAFTPLVNWPQVAILGISPATMQPVWNGKDFDPRLMLPLSLSYDHRVINGADAARFTNKLSKLLADIRNILL
ncbi:2-oxo acid dehydrogenase subunit E2 [Acinetobacter sp. 1207_04]|uniref:2-oxo acid dehydrogenase subunit E2 n=1 Tax=Acinetobacter sp. 1207_04 TaxID=2604449 RepID=UPI004058A572